MSVMPLTIRRDWLRAILSSSHIGAGSNRPLSALDISEHYGLRFEGGIALELVPVIAALVVYMLGRVRDRIGVFSAESEPGDAINAAAVAVMAEQGIDLSHAMPQILTTDAGRQAVGVEGPLRRSGYGSWTG